MLQEIAFRCRASLKLFAKTSVKNTKMLQGETSMVKRIDTIILLVDDIEESVRFYKEDIGISLKFKSPGWAEFVIGDIHLALHRKNNELIEQGNAVGAVGVSVNFEVADIDRLASRLKSHDIEPIGGVKDYEFGRYFFITDPNGYIIGFREYREEYSQEPQL